MIGYFFQCRYALLESLRRIRGGEDFSVFIETLDDVVFETEGKAIELLQTKHHIKNPTNLTDSSTDLWRTLRIWIEGSRSIPENSKFYIVTTSKAPEGSAAYYLKPEREKRNIAKAIERLNATVESSTNQTNIPYYHAFRNLSQRKKELLLDSIRVLDSVPSITDLNSELQKEVHFAVNRRFLDGFLWRLEGWWLKRVIDLLTKKSNDGISSEEIQIEISNLQEQFKQENLPIDDDILQATVDKSKFENCIFIRQLSLINVGGQRIFYAIEDYYRAFTQRSRWVREDLLTVGESGKYERRLIEHWKVPFARMLEELEGATEQEKIKVGRNLYGWAAEASIPIRRYVEERFITTGSYHMLADQLRVGWHPEFKQKLRIEPKEATQ